MKKLLRLLVLLIPLFFAAAVALAVHLFNLYAPFMNISCASKTMLGIYCPACGNTRAVLSLLRGDVLSSLHYNATIIILLLIGLIFYVELVARVFNKKLIIFPRRPLFVCIMLAVMLIYYVLRNFVPFLMPI